MPPESGLQPEVPSEALDAAIHLEQESLLVSITPLVLNGIAAFSRVSNEMLEIAQKHPLVTKSLQLISKLELNDEQLVAQHVAVAGVGGLFGGIIGFFINYNEKKSVKETISNTLRYVVVGAVTAEVLFITARAIIISND